MRSLVLCCLWLALVAHSTATALSSLRRASVGPQRLDSASARALQVGAGTQEVENHKARHPAWADRALAAVFEAKGFSSQVEPRITAFPAHSATEHASSIETNGSTPLDGHLVDAADQLATTFSEPTFKAATKPTKPVLRKRCHYIGTFFRRIDCNAPADSTAIPYSHASVPVATQA